MFLTYYCRARKSRQDAKRNLAADSALQKQKHRPGGGISKIKLTKVLHMFNSALLSQLGFWRSVITVVRKDSYLWFGGSMLNIVLLTELRKSYVKSGQKLHSRPLAGKLGRSHHSQVHERGDQATVCTRDDY
jgi:hypothetical protein